MSDLRWHRSCLLGLTLALTVSCGIDQNALASVGDRRVDIGPFQTYVGEVTGEAWQAVSARVTSRLLDQYLDRQVVLEAARRGDVNLSAISPTVGPSEVQWLLDELCGPAPEPSEDEISTEVERKAEETQPARAHVRQLLLDSHEQGLEALQRLSSRFSRWSLRAPPILPRWRLRCAPCSRREWCASTFKGAFVDSLRKSVSKSTTNTCGSHTQDGTRRNNRCVSE